MEGKPARSITKTPIINKNQESPAKEERDPDEDVTVEDEFSEEIRDKSLLKAFPDKSVEVHEIEGGGSFCECCTRCLECHTMSGHSTVGQNCHVKDVFSRKAR